MLTMITGYPSVQNYRSIFVLSQTSLTSIEVYKKIHQHLQQQISFIMFPMKYVLTVHLFELVDVNIFSKNLVKVREV